MRGRSKYRWSSYLTAFFNLENQDYSALTLIGPDT